MIISEENDKPVEMAAKTTDVYESKKYVIVKNHIREIPVDKKELINKANIIENKKNKKKSQKRSIKMEHQDKLRSCTESEHNSHEEENIIEHQDKSRSCTESEHNSHDEEDMIEYQESRSCTESEHISDEEDDIISKSDLDELRTVYKRCRDVLNRLESKYGHLLNLDKNGSKQNKKQKRKLNDELSEHKCKCMFNKKIIFNEDGEQISTQPSLEKHICHKKLKLNCEPSPDKQSIQIEYEQIDTLPDDLRELADLLKCDNIKRSDRNKIIIKMKTIKQEHLNDIRFDKASLKEKLKSNPDEIMDFRGTNLASLPGYILY